MHTTCFTLFLSVFSVNIWCEIDDNLRPAAIIPWSEYQRRMRMKAALSPVEKSTFGDHRKSPQRVSEQELFREAVAELDMITRQQQMAQLSQQRTNPSANGFVIRPQLRKKVTEPSDYQTLGMTGMRPPSIIMKPSARNPPNYHPPTSPEQFPYQKLNNLAPPPTQYTTENIQQPPKYTSLSNNPFLQGSSFRKSSLSEANDQYRKMKGVDGTRISQFGGDQRMMSSQRMMVPSIDTSSMSAADMQKLAMYAKHFNIPAGALRNGVPNGGFSVEQMARQLGTPNLVDPRIPIGEISQNIAPQFTRIGSAPTPLSVDQASNLVNSIFTQSQQRAAGTPLQPVLQGANIPGIQQVPLHTNGANPLETMFANGSPLEQIGKLAKSLLMQGGGSGSESGQNDLLTAGLRALQQRGSALEGLVDAPAETRSSPSMMEKLFSSAAQAINHGIKEQERQAKIDAIKKDEHEKNSKFKTAKTSTVKLDEEKERSLALLEGVPKDQRDLLEAAIRSGELDPETLRPALKTLVKEDTKEESKTEKETRLLEWIQQNRPTRHDIVVASDKLPYYGKYCGSFAEQTNSTRKFRPTGAVWAVDNRRFIVSKFFFQPGSLYENVTFWAGPNNSTSDAVSDMFPSQNGFYMKPVPLDVSIFATRNLPPIEAKIRERVAANVTVQGLPQITSLGVNGTQTIGRKRRDAVVTVQKDETPASKKQEDGTIHLVVKGGMVKVENGAGIEEKTVSASEFPALPTNTVISPVFRIRQPEEDVTPDPSSAAPLEWYAGFQPLLLTLPDHKWMKTTHWIALRDHRKQETIASILIPNGPAFQVPAIVQLRSFSPNGPYNISSGAIKVIDTKTIEITDLVIKSNGIPLWFMIGKDILPNASGNIVPIYDPKIGTFDCDNLRDYNGESVFLRLPGTLDIKDVFWFSIFSIPNAVSYSHIYLPYNDMHVPPDLQGIPTPKCEWKGK